jgi:hypothetical protein
VHGTVEERRGAVAPNLRPVRAEKAATTKPAKQKRVKWQKAEVGMLKGAVKTHGVGRWAKAVEDKAFLFDARGATSP